MEMFVRQLLIEKKKTMDSIIQYKKRLLLQISAKIKWVHQ